MSAIAPGPDAAIPAARIDWAPIALVPLVALVSLAVVPSASTWLTLTVAGLAMGMMIFVMSSGMTLVFGLMDVMNFAHGLFIAIGAYIATSAMRAFSGPASADSFAANLGALAPSPGAETHIAAFAVDGGYLHTSPEFACKKLLAAGEEKLFTFAPVFRNRERGQKIEVVGAKLRAMMPFLNPVVISK